MQRKRPALFKGRTLVPEIVEMIMPEREHNKAIVGYQRPMEFHITVETDGVPVARDRDGAPLGGEAQRYVEARYPHGFLEFFLAEAGFRHRLMPAELDHVRKALGDHLGHGVLHWAAEARPVRKSTPGVHPLPAQTTANLQFSMITGRSLSDCVNKAD